MLLYLYIMRLTPILLLLFISKISFGQTLTTLYFNIGAYEIGTQNAYVLDSLVYYNAITPNKKYNIIGYADNTGGEQINEQLSNLRASSVFNYLNSLGIDSNNISIITGKGAIGTKGENNRGNRKVEIVANAIIKREKDKELVDSTIKIDIDNIREGAAFNLEKLFFIGGKAIVQPQSKPTLEELLKVMKTNPKLTIQLEGHVHYDPGTPIPPAGFKDGEIITQTKEEHDASMQKLSEDRAIAVRDYLIEKGIDDKRIKVIGYSYSKILFSPKNNRRVQVRVLSK